MEKTAFPQGDRVSCLWTSFRALMGPATKMVPGRRIYINIKKSESNFFYGKLSMLMWKFSGRQKKCYDSGTCLCHGNLFPLYLVHTEKSVAKEAPLRETEKSFFSLSPPLTNALIVSSQMTCSLLHLPATKSSRTTMFLPIFRNRRKPKLHQSSYTTAALQTIINSSTAILPISTVVVHTVHTRCPHKF